MLVSWFLVKSLLLIRLLGRSFIQPSMRLRRLAVAKKFGPLAQNFMGKSIILIDDSIVRGRIFLKFAFLKVNDVFVFTGTTIGQLIRLLKDAGAKDVHIRLGSISKN